jgi:hypothetical protein
MIDRLDSLFAGLTMACVMIALFWPWIARFL